MKKFSFPLTRVRDWRRLQLEGEEAKLEPLLSERSGMRMEADALTFAERLAADGCAASVAERVALAAYVHYAGGERKRIAARLAACETRIRAQQEAILSARRKLRPLENLEKRRFSAWQAAADREQESLAQELFLARRARTRTGAS